MFQITQHIIEGLWSLGPGCPDPRADYHYFLKQGLVSNSSGGVKRRDNKPPRIKCQCWKGAKHQLVQPPQYTEDRGCPMAPSTTLTAGYGSCPSGCPGNSVRRQRDLVGGHGWQAELEFWFLPKFFNFCNAPI